jgi:hypothetical protein
MNHYDVEFVFERMVIITTVEVDEPIVTDEFVIDEAKKTLTDYYKIDPEVLYLQDVIIHEWE